MTALTDRLDAMQARAEVATDGPWTANLDTADLPWVASPHFSDIDDVVVIADSTCTPDAQFIAHARTDLPAAIAALRAVLTEADRWEDLGYQAHADVLRDTVATALRVTS